jgi:hypothetical protein
MSWYKLHGLTAFASVGWIVGAAGSSPAAEVVAVVVELLGLFAGLLNMGTSGTVSIFPLPNIYNMNEKNAIEQKLKTIYIYI